MKTKILIILIILTSSFFAKSQYKAPSRYGTDVILNNSSVYQNYVKLSIAYNGWMFAAFTTYDAVGNAGGICIVKSTDNGTTWNIFFNSSVVGSFFPAIDIKVVGNNENSLYLYLAGGQNESGAIESRSVFLNKYDANNINNYSGTLYSKNLGLDQVIDIDLESDYISPGENVNPYSVAFVYALKGSTSDSVKFVLSSDGGQTFTTEKNIHNTTNFIRKVSLSFGKANIGFNGRYFAAWDEYSSPSNSFGQIYTSRNINTAIGAWITPIRLDNMSPYFEGKCRNPSIASQYGSANNDSSSITTLILCENSFGMDASTMGISMFMNYKSHYSNMWLGTTVTEQSGVKKEPHISYDTINRNFLMTYFDSTQQKLPFYVCNINSNSWYLINEKYNDENLLTIANPRVEINPIYTQVAHVWIKNGQAMFDAEHASSAIINQSANNKSLVLFPNPSNTNLTVSMVGLENQKEADLYFYNSNGQLIMHEPFSGIIGEKNSETINVSDWSDGVYLVKVVSSNKTEVSKFVIKH